MSTVLASSLGFDELLFPQYKAFMNHALIMVPFCQILVSVGGNC